MSVREQISDTILHMFSSLDSFQFGWSNQYAGAKSVTLRNQCLIFSYATNDRLFMLYRFI